MAQAERTQGDPDAEHAVLALGLSDSKLWPSILARVSADDFSSPWVGRLIAFASEQAAAGTLVGLAELGSRVPSGERQQLIALRSQAPAASRLSYWCDRVREASGRARLARVGWRLRSAGTAQQSVSEIAATVSREVAEIVAPGVSARILEPADWLARWWSDMERRAEAARTNSALAIPTGIPTIDREILVEPGHMVLVAAATGVGKTAFGLSVARSAARAGKTALYANTEMEVEDLATRLLSAETGVSTTDLRRGMASAEGWHALSAARERIARDWRLPMSEPLAGTDPEAIAHLARARKAERGLDVLVVDYVGRLEIEPKNGEREWQVLERMAAGMKALAVGLHTAVYLLVQRTEDGTIAGSRRMRNDADLVLEILPIGEDDQKARDRWPAASHLLSVTKARHARGGFPIPVLYDPQRMTWAEVGRR